jgi:hypothetical protein
MEVSGRYGPEDFRETVANWAHPVEFCLETLRSSGFKDAYAARADDLGKPLVDPEREKRVFLVAFK